MALPVLTDTATRDPLAVSFAARGRWWPAINPIRCKTGRDKTGRFRTMNLIAHVEIPVSDLERAMCFYGAVFSVAFGEIVTIHENRMAFFPFQAGGDGASGALAEGPVYVPSLEGAIPYLNVDDIDAALARAVEAGGKVLFAKTPIGTGGFVAEIGDSEGNRIAVQAV